MSRVAPKYPNRIKASIRAAGYKIREITEELNIPERTMQAYLSGQMPMPREYLEAVATIPGYPVDILAKDLDRREHDGRGEDWGEAPHIEKFYGREKELVGLHQWIMKDHCRVVTILGIGGIGKTSLAAAVADQVKEAFASVFWRSLQHAPPLKSFL